MRCPQCDVAVSDGQRFCHECGGSLSGVTDPTEQIDAVPSHGDADNRDADKGFADDGDDADDVGVGPDTLTSETVDPPSHAEPEPLPSPTTAPTPAPTRTHRGALPDLARPMPPDAAPSGDVAAPFARGPVDAGAASDPDRAFRPTEEIDAVTGVIAAPANPLDSVPWRDDTPAVEHEPTTTMPASAMPTPTDPYPSVDQATTGEFPTVANGGLFDGAHDAAAAAHPDQRGFTLRASLVFAFLAMVATLMASIADVVDVRTSVPIDGIAPGIRILDDVGSNLAIGGYIGTSLMLLGGLIACFGFRWGAGLAGGAGLSVAGWAALTIGLVERPLFDARTTFGGGAGLPAGAVLTTTRSLGWFLLLAVGLLGGLAFLVSLRQAGTGGRRGLNPWVAAVGALGTVVLAAGPLIPLGAADLSSNLGFDTEPRAFFLGRLIQLGVLVFTGVLGFLSVRTYGLGLAAGGMSVVIWMWATTIAGLGSGPIGPALGNLGSSDTTPHAVTGVGVAVGVLMLAIAVTIAVVSRPRHA